MYTICMRQKEGTYTHEDIKVNVTKEPYPVSGLFHRYKHKPGNKWLPLHQIKLYQSSKTEDQGYVVISTDGMYVSQNLDYVHIYFNRYDSKNANPLILVLFFKESYKFPNRYSTLYPYKSNEVLYKNIYSLSKYTTEEKLLPVLIRENKKINGEIKFIVQKSDKNKKVIQFEEKIGNNFKSVTFVPSTDISGTETFREIYELYSSNLIKDVKNQIDYYIIRKFDHQMFNAVCVYYKDEGNVALLVEFVRPLTIQQIRRIKVNESPEWVREQYSVQYNCTEEIINHLKIILFGLENKIIIRLDKKGEYTDNRVVDNVTTNVSKKQNQKTMDVKKGCDKASYRFEGYTCYIHDIKKYYDTYIKSIIEELKTSCRTKFDVHFELITQITSLKVSLFDIYGHNKNYIYYKPGPGPPKVSDLFVFFYNQSGNFIDTVPLMLKHDNKFYGPVRLENYFTGWDMININIPLDISDPKDNIKTELENVNKRLNEIKLDKTSTYGLPEPSSGKDKLSDFKTERITVKCEPINSTGVGGVCPKPLERCLNSMYSRYTHTTINQFRLGDIKYKNVEVKVEEDGGHGQPITPIPGQNLLEVYYLTADTNRKYPLLIGVGKQPGTGGGVSGDYYKLKTVGTNVKKAADHKWQRLREEETSQIKPSTKLIALLNKINYEVKKVLKIELDKQSQYQAKVKNGSESPPSRNGNSFQPLNGPNGQNGNDVKVEECVECGKVRESRYKCFCHKLTSLKSVNDIGGLKFCLPQKLPIQNGSNGSSNNGQEITLHKKEEKKEDKKPQANGSTQASNGPVQSTQASNNTKIEQIYYNQCMGDVYVYFYTGDPRPGLICFGNTAYKPKKLPLEGTEKKYDYTQNDGCKDWIHVEEIKSCLCDTDEELEVLLGVLTEVYFGNAFIKFFSEYWMEFSAGSGSGVVGLGGVAGGGYLFYAYFDNIRWLI